jgi:hypothetical protein
MHLGIHTVSFDFPDATAPIEVTKAVPQANPGSRLSLPGSRDVFLCHWPHHPQTMAA